MNSFKRCLLGALSGLFAAIAFAPLAGLWLKGCS